MKPLRWIYLLAAIIHTTTSAVLEPHDGTKKTNAEDEDNEAMEVDDIWLTPEQSHMIEEYTENTAHERKKRKAYNFQEMTNNMWKMPIYYTFDNSHDGRQKDIIRNAFREWEDKTCVRFYEISQFTRTTRSFINITKKYGRGCLSYVGQLSEGSSQVINIGDYCLSGIGSAIHEIGHALGLWHEHQRPDRDDSIVIREKNIKFRFLGMFSKFPKRMVDTKGVSYDYTSIMHYTGMAGTRNGGKTIETKNFVHQRSIGQRVQLSFLDAKIINLAYCRDRCSGHPLKRPCQRGGYQNPKDCKRCICSDGLGGDVCDRAADPVIEFCGGDIYLQERQTKVITSPGYDKRKPYSSDQECSWLIKVPKGHKILLQFVDKFGIYCRYRSNVCYHWLEVKVDPKSGLPGPRFCCFETPQDRLVSIENEMVLIFKALYRDTVAEQRVGFKLFITAVAVPGYQGVESPAQQHTSIERSTTTATERPTTVGLQSSSTVATTSSQIPGSDWKWSDWSECTGHSCYCGGYSFIERRKECIIPHCDLPEPTREEKDCDRVCTSNDKQLIYIGRYLTVPCRPCKRSFKDVSGRCVPGR